MGKVPRRKRLYNPKTGRRSRNENAEDTSGDTNVDNSESATESTRSDVTSPCSLVSMDHDYVTSPTFSDNTGDSPAQPDNPCPSSPNFTTFQAQQQADNIAPVELLMQVKEKVELFLTKLWMVIVDSDKLHVVFLSIKKSACIQRSIIFHPNGNEELFVHCELVDSADFTQGLDPPLPLSQETVNNFVDRIVSVVNNVRKMSVCSGLDEVKYEKVWALCPYGEVDKNIFLEDRYVETFRSLNCKRLVHWRKWRCGECMKLRAPLRRRAEAVAQEERNYNTANILLTEEQKLKKLKHLKNELNILKRKNYRLQERMQKIITKEGIRIDGELADSLSEILSHCNVSPAQSIFLQQQVKASQQKNACGMRWHPTMIRFALSFHLTSPAAYELARQTGMIRLPSSRTLFDYSNVKPVEEGVDKVVLESLEARIRKFDKKHMKYHVIMADEMHISQNLVFQKSSGQLIGYTSLDTIDKELKELESWIDATEAKMPEQTVASKVLVYMVKGVTNGIKAVVATFATGNLSANQLKDWTWHVIGDLEKHGIAIVAGVCDGSTVNRAFIKKHKPVTIHPKGVVFDTWNKAAGNRKLYFIADTPHLLKTIRNCMLNSRWDKKSRRRMVRRGKKICWDYIIKLYEMKKGMSLRKSYKLNAQNVYPDSYARMKVKLAGQILSTTVSKDMQRQGWNNAQETILFIQLVNDWFDCLNGAHSAQGQRTRNKNLLSYKSKEDERFKLLEEFLKYLDDWETEAEISGNESLNATALADNSLNVDTPDCDRSEIENAGFNPDADTPASKRILSRETLEGIRITTSAFKPLVHFLLDEGATFVNARVFCQDPLEQHFSKVRAGQGGSTNPNVNQVLKRNRALHTIGEMGMRKRKGNSGEEANVVEVTNDLLPKRPCNRVPKLGQ